MTDLDALIRDIEAATGPDCALDERIAMAMGWRRHKIASTIWIRADDVHTTCTDFTWSLDAARMTFGELDYRIEHGVIHGCRLAFCEIEDADEEEFYGQGATEPLAMCAASMSLKQQEG